MEDVGVAEEDIEVAEVRSSHMLVYLIYHAVLNFCRFLFFVIFFAIRKKSSGQKKILQKIQCSHITFTVEALVSNRLLCYTFMRHCIICNHLNKISFQSLWMRDLYIGFRTFRRWPASISVSVWSLTTAHSHKRPALVMTTLSNSRVQ